MQKHSLKRVLFALLLGGLLGAPGAFGASSSVDAESSSSDVIVLLDISQSVLPYFHDITDYVVSSVVKDFLRIGDTFHLISFGESSQVEIAQRVAGEQDVRSILARLYLLYPIARNTDLVGAMGYLYQYLADLPESRSKVVVLITDGVSNPPPASAESGKDTEAMAKDLEVAAARIRSNGWPVYIIKVPFSAERAAAEAKGNPKAGAAPDAAEADKALGTLADALNTTVTDYSTAERGEVARRSLSLPVAEFPADLGKRGYAFSFPLRIHNEGDGDVSLELLKVRSGDEDLLRKKAFITIPAKRSGTLDIKVQLNPDLPAGPLTLPVDLYFADGLRVSPSHGSLSLTLAPSLLANLFRSGSRLVLFIVLVVVGLLLVGVAVGFLARRGPRKAAAPVVAAVREAEEERKEAADRKRAAAATGAAPSPAPAVGTVPAKAAPAAATVPGTGRTAPQGAAPGGAATAGVAPSGAAPSGTAPSGAAPAESTPAGSAAAGASPVGASPTGSAGRGEGVAEGAVPETTGSRREREALRKSAAAAAPSAISVVRPGTIQLELRVADQNPAIGLRNVHALHAGQGRSVGGGRSDFLVFLVKVPARVAEIVYDGENCHFQVLRPEYFPGLPAEGLRDCLGKDIPMVSTQGYPLVLRFTKYVSPVDKVNRLLHCIETPGLFSDEES